MFGRRMRNVLAAICLVAGTAAVTGAIVAEATSGPAGFYACLKSGVLSDVQLHAHSCPSGRAVVSWNAVGPRGAPGQNGVTRDCALTPYPGIDLAACNLAGVKFTDDNLTGANLTAVNLTNAFLVGDNLTEANFAAATMHGVSSAGITGSPAALPLGWCVVNGYLTGPYANLVNDDLSNAEACDLSFADLMGANLSYDRLPGTGGANFTNANLTGAVVVTSGALTDDNFTNANWTDGNLASVNTTGSIFTGVTWSNTTCPDGTNSDADGNTCAGHLG